MADGFVRVDGWGAEVQPGTITLITVEDRIAAEEAATAAAAAQGKAEEAAGRAEEASTNAATPIPPGGAQSQVLAKKSGQDRDVEWVDPAVGGGGDGIQNAPSTWPETFPPSGHKHAMSDIEGSTAIGRDVLSAGTQQAARQAIGAGTGNGTSNLGLGSSSTQAAPGNHSHGAASISFVPKGAITATDVQTAIEQASTTGSGGGGGTATTLDVKYASGGYPTQPSTPPAGVTIRHFYGPVMYSGPTWVGVLDVYTPAELV